MKPKFNLKLEMRRIGKIVETYDQEGKWGTVGTHENIIVASWFALVDSYVFKLLKNKSNW